MPPLSFSFGITDDAVAVLVSNPWTLDDKLFARLEEKHDLFASSRPVGAAVMITAAMASSL